MELISKEELIDRMYHEAFEVDSEMQKFEGGCWIRYKLFENILDEVPTIESRPKGKWEETHSPWTEIECSNCKIRYNVEFILSEKPRHYCPNCGADMRGEE